MMRSIRNTKIIILKILGEEWYIIEGMVLCQLLLSVCCSDCDVYVYVEECGFSLENASFELAMCICYVFEGCVSFVFHDVILNELSDGVSLLGMLVCTSLLMN